MATEVKVPTLGESVTEATVGELLKNVGDAVAVDEPIVSLETDKVAVEAPSPVAGVIKEFKVAVGDTVEIDAIIAVIEEGAAPAADQASRLLLCQFQFVLPDPPNVGTIGSLQIAERSVRLGEIFTAVDRITFIVRIPAGHIHCARQRTESHDLLSDITAQSLARLGMNACFSHCRPP